MYQDISTPAPSLYDYITPLPPPLSVNLSLFINTKPVDPARLPPPPLYGYTSAAPPPPSKAVPVCYPGVRIYKAEYNSIEFYPLGAQ